RRADRDRRLLAQVALGQHDRTRALLHRHRYLSCRTVAHITGREHSRNTGLEPQRCAVKRPRLGSALRDFEVWTGYKISILVALDRLLQPGRAWLSAQQDEQAVRADRLGRPADTMADNHALQATLAIGIDNLAVDAHPDVPGAFDLFDLVWRQGGVDRAAQHDRHIPGVAGQRHGGRPG